MPLGRQVSLARLCGRRQVQSGLFLLNGKIEIDDTFLDVLYKCNMDGSCDISCKVPGDIEPLQHMQALRIKCVEEGQLVPAHMLVIEGLQRKTT